MKRILFIVSMIATVAVSCKKNDVVVVEASPEYYEVKLGIGGELPMSVSPLTKAGSPNDITAFQVYAAPEDGGPYICYAKGLFDDTSNVTVKLQKGNKYRFVACTWVDAKNIYSNPGDNHYVVMVYGERLITNKFSYSNERIGQIEYCITPDGDMNRPLNSDFYAGMYDNYVPTSNGSVSIDMIRAAFGLKIVAEDFTEGTLSCKITGAKDVIINYPTSLFETIYMLAGIVDYDYEARQGDDYPPYKVSPDKLTSISVSVMWEKADGTMVPIGTKVFDAARNKLYTITVKCVELESSGVSVSYDSTPISSGDNFTLGGTGTEDTDIDTNK